MIGRVAELRQVDALWSAGERLVTLLGHGGIGKTHLALELARRHTDAEVIVCALDGVVAVDELVARVAEAIGLEPEGGGPSAIAIDRVGRALARGAPLLVLDEMERLVPHVAPVLRGWLARAPELRCLVTSRRALGLDEEVRVEVGPLAEADAVALFVAQARRVRPGWSPASGEAAAVAELARRLDGVPLAIKLCAARAALLTPAELLARLQARFSLLRGGTDGGVSHHRSLEAALDGSWELLADRERHALARLAVLPGAFSVAVAETVLGGDALDALQALRADALLRRIDAPEPGGSTLLAVPESIRSYAADRLDELGARADAEAAAAEGYARLAAQGDVARLRHERANLLFAIEHLVAHRPERGIELLLAVDRELAAGARRDRHRALLAGAVAAARALGDDDLLPRALVVHADALWQDGQLVDADRAADEAHRVARSVAGRADALRIRGEAARAGGEAARAGAWLDEALRGARAAGDRRLEARVRDALASLHYAARRFERVAAEAAAALAIWRELDEPGHQAFALAATGLVALETDRGDDARGALHEALALYRAAGHPRGEARVLGMLAELAWADGAADAAASACRQAIALHEAQGAHPWIEAELARLAVIEVARGKTAEALACARRAETEMGAGEFVRIRVLVHVARGIAEAATGAVGAARAAFASARRTAAELEPVVQAYVELAAGMIDAAQAARARASGDLAGADRALARARARLDAPPSSADASRARSCELRAAARVVEAALAGVGAAPEPPSDSLRVEDDGGWFAPPAGARVAVERRAWARVLAELARQRLAAPGEGLSTDALFAAGWPGERALSHAARNRVWVALSGLRGLGLEPFLVRRRGRYLLDPGVPLAITPR